MNTDAKIIKSAKQAGVTLAKLGSYIKETRDIKKWSLRAIEQKSKELYPKNPEKQISNGYLNLLEKGEIGSIHPYKLRTISLILQCDYFKLLQLADYLDDSEILELNNNDLLTKYSNLSKKYQKIVMSLINELTKIDGNKETAE